MLCYHFCVEYISSYIHSLIRSRTECLWLLWTKFRLLIHSLTRLFDPSALQFAEHYGHEIILSASTDRTCSIFSAETCENLLVLNPPSSEGHALEPVYSHAEFLENPKFILTSSLDSSIRIWDLNTLTAIKEFQGQHN